MAEALLKAENLVKLFGSIRATDDLSLTLYSGELHALIGPNGAGKTTLVSQLSGEMQSTSGRVLFCGKDITQLDFPSRAELGIARSFQITCLCNEFTAAENIALAVQSENGDYFKFWKSAWRNKPVMDRAHEILAEVRLSRVANTPAAELSHGERRQLELGVALAINPRLLMLDEPLAGMAREDAKEMVDLIRSLKDRFTILLIEHDMDAVFGLADRISVLVYGSCIATGTPDAISRDAEVRRAYLGDGRRHAGR